MKQNYKYVCEPYSLTIPRGAFTTAKYLADKQGTEVIRYCDIEKYRNEYNFIFTYQVPHKHSKYYTPRLYRKGDIVFSRDEYADRYLTSVTNGFSYFKQSKNIKGFIPTPFTSTHTSNKVTNQVIGHRRYARQDILFIIGINL